MNTVHSMVKDWRLKDFMIFDVAITCNNERNKTDKWQKEKEYVNREIECESIIIMWR